MQMLQNMKAWVQQEVVGGWNFVQFAVKEVWWTAVLAAGMQYLGGGTGGVKEFAGYMLLLRTLKMPLEILYILKYDLQYFTQALKGLSKPSKSL
jgi:hypothetical protein